MRAREAYEQSFERQPGAVSIARSRGRDGDQFTRSLFRRCHDQGVSHTQALHAGRALHLLLSPLRSLRMIHRRSEGLGADSFQVLAWTGEWANDGSDSRHSCGRCGSR